MGKTTFGTVGSNRIALTTAQSVGSAGPDCINARDERGGDLITCRSADTRVIADDGDVISGPCLQVAGG